MAINVFPPVSNSESSSGAGPDNAPHVVDKYKYIVATSTGNVQLPEGYDSSNPLTADVIVVGGGSGANGINGGGGGEVKFFSSQSFTSAVPVVIGAGGATSSAGSKSYINILTSKDANLLPNPGLLNGNWVWRGPTSGGSGDFNFSNWSNGMGIASAPVSQTLTSQSFAVGRSLNSNTPVAKFKNDSNQQNYNVSTHTWANLDVDSEASHFQYYSVGGNGNFWNTSIFNNASGSQVSLNDRFVWQHNTEISVTPGDVMQFGFIEWSQTVNSTSSMADSSRAANVSGAAVRWSDGTASTPSSTVIENTVWNLWATQSADSQQQRLWNVQPRLRFIEVTVPAGVTWAKPEIYIFQAFRYWNTNQLGLNSAFLSFSMPFFRVKDNSLKGYYNVSGRSAGSSNQTMTVKNPDVVGVVSSNGTTSGITQAQIASVSGNAGGIAISTGGSTAGTLADGTPANPPSNKFSNSGGRGARTAYLISQSANAAAVTMQLNVGAGGGGAAATGQNALINGLGGEGGTGILYRFPVNPGDPTLFNSPGFSAAEGGWVVGGGGGGLGVGQSGKGRHGGGTGGINAYTTTAGFTPASIINGTNGIANTGGGGGGQGGNGGSGAIIFRYEE
jgi:hypothetical protein